MAAVIAGPGACCFLPWPGGGDVGPYPAGTVGLPFARAAVIAHALTFVLVRSGP